MFSLDFWQKKYFINAFPLLFMVVFQELNGSSHSLRLENTLKSFRREPGQQRLETRQSKFKNTKKEVLQNIEDSIRHQVDENAYYYAWSGLDLKSNGMLALIYITIESTTSLDLHVSITNC